MKTAIFGGTFNPVHIGHLLIAEEVLAQTDCDNVLFIPANIPPHKHVEDPGSELRLSMLEKSIAENPRFRVSNCEIIRSGISYSIDTIRYLVNSGIVESKPCLLIGDDLVEGFSSWKESQAIAQESSLLIVHRLHAKRIPVFFPHEYIENAIFPISSTVVREKIAKMGAWRYLVPEAARKIIEEHRLYGFNKF